MGEEVDRQLRAFEDLIAAEVFQLTGGLLASTKDEVTVAIQPPNADAVKRYVGLVRPQRHLAGSVSLGNRALGWSVRLEIPMPFDDVFLAHNPASSERTLYAWSNTMKEAPGFRWVTRERDGQTCWRVALNDGTYWEGGEARRPSLAANRQSPFTVLSSLTHYPDWLRALLPHPTCRVLHPVDKQGHPIRIPSWPQFRQLQRMGRAGVPEQGDLDTNPTAHRIAQVAESMCGKIPPTDEFRLENKIISDYWHFLRTEIPTTLLTVILGACWVEAELWPTCEAIWKCLEDPSGYDQDITSQVWEMLARRELGMRLEYSLSRKIIGKQGRAEPLEKLLNPVAAASRRTKFLKFPTQHPDRVAVHRRQNHPSFMGAVCPVQTPESKSVGLALHTSRGAAVEKGTGRVTGASEGTDSADADALGYAASLVPFFEYNDGARNMMAAKNLCQAVPLEYPEPPLIGTSGEKLIASVTKGLAEAGLVPHCLSGGRLALGRNLLVAYMPWYGYNSDDAIIVGKHVVDEGLFDYVQTSSYSRQIPGGYIADSAGVPGKGKHLLPGDSVARFIPCDGKGRPEIVTYTGRYPAVLRDVSWALLEDTLDGWGTLQYVVEIHWPLGLGDKLMGRHGNKGVIGRVEPAMPCLPVCPSLGDFSGRPVDLILNPHGVISRMNVGQLLETQVGWLLAHGVPASELATANNNASVGEPFQRALDFTKLRTLTVTTGLDEHGKTPLMLPASDGRVLPTRCPVFVGIQHIVRLDHIANNKAHARGKDPDYEYSALSGQPVGGKSRGGGQKLGEMELWGLAAHEAWQNLEEVLTTKSRQSASDPLFADQLQELLFAFGIEAQFSHGKHTLRFSVAGDAQIGERSFGEVKNRVPLRRQEALRFGCVAKTCSYRLGNLPLLTGKGNCVTLQDVLDHRGWCLLEFVRVDDSYELRLGRGSKGGGHRLVFSAKPRSGTRTDTLLVDCAVSTQYASAQNLPLHLQSFTLYGRFPARASEQEEYGETNVPASAMLEIFQVSGGARSVTDLFFTCPDHSSRKLSPFGAPKEVLRGHGGSFYAPEIFGALDGADRADSEKRWGHLELPVPVDHPLATLFPSIHAKQPFPKLTVLPILPLSYRMPLLGNPRIPTPKILDSGYYPVCSCIHSWKRILANEGKEKAVALLARKVAHLFKQVRELLPVGGKEGLIRSVGFGKRVDFSARMVIIPDPSLEWGQVGLPLAAFIELFRDDLATWVCSSGSPISDVSMREILRSWRWGRDRHSVAALEQLLAPCRQFLAERPEISLILNRQPSLHKYSLQAFRPVIVGDLRAHVLRVSPLICAAFGADFDGDEMTLHRPLAQEALKEASELMTPRWNLISIANGRPVCNFDQDFVLGTFLLYQPSLGFRDEFLKLLPQELHASVPSGVCYEKSVGMDLIKELCQRFPEEAEAVVGEWARLAFRACTELGVSFSFTELQDLARQTTGSAAGLSPEQLAKEHLRRIIESDSAVSKSGYHFAAMSQSGARGRKQVPQILVSRGHLSPGRLPYRTSVEDMTFSESLLDGFDLSTFWRTGLNARSSMCDKNLGTAGGGYLTRRLVFACSGVRIASDCLTGTRDGVLGCQTPGGVCGACFGSSPDGRSLSPGFPIGLVTAQSIGERGTQLSMQSFHTGQKVASIAEVEALLDDHAYLFECTVTGCEKMVIMRRADCTELPLDSSGLPVCPDHAGPMRRIECDNLFGSQAAGHFVRAMRSLDAYRSLDQRYIQLLWKILAARGGGLRRALDALKGSGAELGFERQLEHMAGLAARNASVGLQHLLDRLLFTTGSGGWGGAAMEEET